MIIRGISGVTLSSLQKSLVVEKTHEQTIVIKSEFSKGWVTRMIEGHPRVHILIMRNKRNPS